MVFPCLRQQGIYRSLGLFLSKAAYCEMRLGSKEEASRLGSQALLLYKELHSNWGGYLLGGALLFNVLAWIEVEKRKSGGSRRKLTSSGKTDAHHAKTDMEGNLFDGQERKDRQNDAAILPAGEGYL